MSLFRENGNQLTMTREQAWLVPFMTEVHLNNGEPANITFLYQSKTSMVKVRVIYYNYMPFIFQLINEIVLVVPVIIKWCKTLLISGLNLDPTYKADPFSVTPHT